MATFAYKLKIFTLALSVLVTCIFISLTPAQASGYYNVGAYWKPATATSNVLTISDVSTNQWGRVHIGTKTGPRAIRMFTLTNTGGGTITSMAAGSPAMSTPFAFMGGSYPGQKGTCGDSLAASQTCTIAVTFAPTATGSYTDTVRVSYLDGTASGTATRSLAGTGFAVTKTAALEFNTAFLTNDGIVYTNGNGAYAQLGDGSMYTNKPFILPVSGITNAIDISAGQGHICTIKSDGTVWCWGKSEQGQVGDTATGYISLPVKVSAITNAVQLSTGGETSCARLSTGYVRCWGSNTDGTIDQNTAWCNGTGGCTTYPVTISGIANAIDMSYTSSYTSAVGCAVVTGGAIRCWGYNANGQLGQSNYVASTFPANTVIGFDGIARIATKVRIFGSMVAALTDTGELYTWGQDTYGQLGTFNTAGAGGATPTIVSILSNNVSSIAESNISEHICVILKDHTVKCWGYNNQGQLGDKTTVSKDHPITITMVSNIQSLSNGVSSSCTIAQNGRVHCWGFSDNGETGDGTYNKAHTHPLEVLGFPVEPAYAAAGGSSVDNGFTCAVMSTGEVKCWGANTGSQIGNAGAAAGANPIPIPVQNISTANGIGAGYQHVCVTLDSGEISCWGTDTNGQLGDGAGSSTTNVPQLVSSISNALYVGVGYQHTCATLRTGEVKCWGAGGASRLGNSFYGTTDQFVPIYVSGISNAVSTAPPAAGYQHSCAALQNGNIKCWGYNFYGAVGDGTSANTKAEPTTVSIVTNAIAVGAGMYHTCSLQANRHMRCWGYDAQGQLGNDGATTNVLTPTTISGGTSNIVSFAVGGYHSCFALANGTTRCAGWDASGQLGNNAAFTDSAVPVVVAGTTVVVRNFTASGSHTCAIIDSPSPIEVVTPTAITVNYMKCWGSDVYGGLGNDASTSAGSGTPVSVGDL